MKWSVRVSSVVIFIVDIIVDLLNNPCSHLTSFLKSIVAAAEIYGIVSRLGRTMAAGRIAQFRV